MLTISKETFIQQYSEAILAENAAVFAGAGLSMQSGYVNWKELLRNLAKQIGLDVDKETDLISVAQYYTNEALGRTELNNEIKKYFSNNQVFDNKTMDSLAKLPIKSYWTTNYDTVIEDTLFKFNKIKPNVKITQENLTNNVQDNDIVVYKLHGDVQFPETAILTRDDYETYDNTHKLFITSLQSALINNTFVFIGYSFSDPNLMQILSKIRILLSKNKRTHYFIVEKNIKRAGQTEDEFKYEEIRQSLRISDLTRYGIRPVLIDSYDELPAIFDEVHRRCKLNKVFIAGSCRKYVDWKKEEAHKFLYLLGYKLIEKNFKISTGMIEGVGPLVVNGVLTAIRDRGVSVDKYLKIRTLPLINGSASFMNKEIKTSYQKDMINEVGIVIFLFGNQFYDNELKPSKGVLHDFNRAIELNKYIIPVGATGFAAMEIQNKLEQNENKYPYLKKYWKKLKDKSNIEELVNTVLEIINDIVTEGF